MKTLARGQKAKLADLAPGDSFKVLCDVDLPGVSGIDVSCFGLDETDNLPDDRYLIFYNQQSSPEGAIVASGLDDEGIESFDIDLARLPSAIRKLVFTATIFSGTHTMSQLRLGWLRLLNLPDAYPIPAVKIRRG